MQPQIRQREYVSKVGYANEGFEFKSSSDEEDGTYLYTDLHEQLEPSKQKRSKHLYRCWCVVLLTVPRPLEPFRPCQPFLFVQLLVIAPACSIIIQTFPLLYIITAINAPVVAAFMRTVTALVTRMTLTKMTTSKTKVDQPYLGLAVLSNCVPVMGQAYMALWLWTTLYALWTVLAREVSETGPIFKPILTISLSAGYFCHDYTRHDGFVVGRMQNPVSTTTQT